MTLLHVTARCTLACILYTLDRSLFTRFQKHGHINLVTLQDNAESVTEDTNYSYGSEEEGSADYYDDGDYDYDAGQQIIKQG